MTRLIAIPVLASSVAFAQLQVTIQLPSVTFEAPPPLVVVESGVQVVPDYHEEVFFHDNWYWVRMEGRWYRSQTYRGGWGLVEPSYVPVVLSRIPPGHYKRWKVKKEKGPPPGHLKLKVKEKKGKR